MSQLSFTSFDALLHVRDTTGTYRLASIDRILAAARDAIDHRMQRGTAFRSPQVVRDFLQVKLSGFEHEVFAVIFLDTMHRLIAYAEMFRGTIDSASVYPREVVKEALRVNAAAVILAHNQPSGNPEPSAADKAITRRLKDALELVDVRTLDHIVVGGHSTTSFAERGLI
ncbi:DNA repair protein RadC [Pseudoxanthomonas sp. GM95]|uniref:RadC family protein n=1 Tax=Pseudoxanthomonas sp. GM95 TaxID=1881043 RepID=UPI0008B29336|nr:DNA repair protein RadC [Pseudoxanthomonas sp. GM95]SEL94829.1 DNA repair protein RadC [Pseudoxanthomonas sp. GM95]